eukprot:IDg621t1
MQHPRANLADGVLTELRVRSQLLFWMAGSDLDPDLDPNSEGERLKNVFAAAGSAASNQDIDGALGNLMRAPQPMMKVPTSVLSRSDAGMVIQLGKEKAVIRAKYGTSMPREAANRLLDIVDKIKKIVGSGNKVVNYVGRSFVYARKKSFSDISAISQS